MWFHRCASVYLSCRKTCFIVSTLINSWLHNMNLHLNPTNSSGSHLCPSTSRISFSNCPLCMALESRLKVYFDGVICQRLIFPSWSYQHTLNLRQISNPVAHWWWTKKESGQDPGRDGCEVGTNKEILPWWTSVKDWQTDRKSTLSEGQWLTISSGTLCIVYRRLSHHPIWLTVWPQLRPRDLPAPGVGNSFLQRFEKKAVNTSLCVWTVTTLCTAFHLRFIKMSWLTALA